MRMEEQIDLDWDKADRRAQGNPIRTRNLVVCRRAVEALIRAIEQLERGQTTVVFNVFMRTQEGGYAIDFHVEAGTDDEEPDEGQLSFPFIHKKPKRFQGEA